MSDDGLAAEEIERFRGLAERGFLSTEELATQEVAIRASVEAGQFTAESLAASELGELAERVEHRRLSRALFDARKQEFLWQPADTGPRADTRFELQESPEPAGIALARGLGANLAAALLHADPETIGRSTILSVIEKTSGAELWRVRGIRLQSELETWRDRIRHDLRSLSVDDFQQRYARRRGRRGD